MKVKTRGLFVCQAQNIWYSSLGLGRDERPWEAGLKLVYTHPPLLNTSRASPLLHLAALKSNVLPVCPSWRVWRWLCPQPVLPEGISILQTLPFNTIDPYLRFVQPGSSDASTIPPLHLPPPQLFHCSEDLPFLSLQHHLLSLPLDVPVSLELKWLQFLFALKTVS